MLPGRMWCTTPRLRARASGRRRAAASEVRRRWTTRKTRGFVAAHLVPRPVGHECAKVGGGWRLIYSSFPKQYVLERLHEWEKKKKKKKKKKPTKKKKQKKQTKKKKNITEKKDK
eukprot:NODE_25040_length_601_cov_9.824895.p4 GENE.NODE_25040_length_601_cov_9.824895~~NODE_25040_length_601_cov_9.824895.p4  ORF type:complete len:115 (+),score=35.92 NODE_25040_length_601_cov_9.824895:201-545(+)